MPLQPARLLPWMFALKRLGLFVFTLILLCPIASAQQKPGSVVAVVNADPITRQSLADATLVRYGADVLDNMVNRHLILQACQENGIKITDTQVRNEIVRLAGKFGLSVDSYLRLLQDERDIAPDQYSNEIVWPMLALRALVAKEVEPTKEEFDRAFLSQFGEAIKCRLIMVPEKGQAEKLRAQAAAKPETFGAMAKQFSKDESSASVGGLIPPIRRYSVDSRLEQAAFALQNNEVSPILQLGDQWVFLQAVRRIAGTTPSPKALPAIQEQIKDRIRDQKMRGASGKLFTHLQEKAKVVKVLGDTKLSVQYPGVAAIVNGQQVAIAAVAAECIKRHGGDVLEGEINRKLLTQALRKAKRTVSDADVRIEVERAAKSFGYVQGDGSADMGAWMESVTSDGNTTAEIYVQDSVWPSVALKKLVEDKVQVTQDDLTKGYESSYGPRVEVLAIVLSDQRTAQKVWEMARDNASDEFFGQLAEQYSVEPVSSSNRGKVPPIRKHGGQLSIEKEAFKLSAGDLSGIVATGDKYIVMRCQGRTNPVVQNISDVQSELVSHLKDKKLAVAMAAEFDRLQDSAEIDNYFEAAKEIPRLASEQSAIRQ